MPLLTASTNAAGVLVQQPLAADLANAMQCMHVAVFHSFPFWLTVRLPQTRGLTCRWLSAPPWAHLHTAPAPPPATHNRRCAVSPGAARGGIHYYDTCVVGLLEVDEASEQLLAVAAALVYSALRSGPLVLVPSG